MTREAITQLSDSELWEVQTWLQEEQEKRKRRQVAEWIRAQAASVGLKVRIRRDKTAGGPVKITPGQVGSL